MLVGVGGLGRRGEGLRVLQSKDIPVGSCTDVPAGSAAVLLQLLPCITVQVLVGSTSTAGLVPCRVCFALLGDQDCYE